MDRRKRTPASANRSDDRGIRYLLFCLEQVRGLLQQGTLSLHEALSLCRRMRSFFVSRFPEGEQELGEAIFDAVHAPELVSAIQILYD